MRCLAVVLVSCAPHVKEPKDAIETADRYSG